MDQQVKVRKVLNKVDTLIPNETSIPGQFICQNHFRLTLKNSGILIHLLIPIREYQRDQKSTHLLNRFERF